MGNFVAEKFDESRNIRRLLGDRCGESFTAACPRCARCRQRFYESGSARVKTEFSEHTYFYATSIIFRNGALYSFLHTFTFSSAFNSFSHYFCAGLVHV